MLGSGEERCQGRDSRLQDRHSSATPDLTSSPGARLGQPELTPSRDPRTGLRGLSRHLTSPAGKDLQAVV